MFFCLSVKGEPMTRFEPTENKPGSRDTGTTDCCRSSFLDYRHYQKCLLDAARLNLKGVYCQDCPEYDRDPDFTRPLWESSYFCADVMQTQHPIFIKKEAACHFIETLEEPQQGEQIQ